MPRRLLARFALLALATLSACGEARSASDEATCSTDAECVRHYRASLVTLQGCLAEHVRAGYVGPGAPPPANCDRLRAETERWVVALNRIRGRKQQEAIEEQSGGFEVPPLPPPTR